MDCTNGKFTQENGYSLQCQSASVRGNVHLRKGFVSKGQVSFLGAEISGQMDCGGGEFFNNVPLTAEKETAGYALHLDLQRSKQGY